MAENRAQWETLARKERQKLGASSALEIAEAVPEPSTWALLAAGLVALAAWQTRRRLRAA